MAKLQKNNELPIINNVKKLKKRIKTLKASLCVLYARCAVLGVIFVVA